MTLNNLDDHVQIATDDQLLSTCYQIYNQISLIQTQGPYKGEETNRQTICFVHPSLKIVASPLLLGPGQSPW